MRELYIGALLSLLLLFSGCGSSEELENSVSVKGSHFQGRDCVACHNLDLQQKRRLFVGGTLFKDKNSSTESLDNTCSSDLVLNFLDANGTKIFSSEDYDGKGLKGRGNLFLLERLTPPSSGSYIMQITTKSGVELAKSLAPHTFNADNYTLSSAKSSENRRSCNACHNSVNGTQPPLYVQKNSNLCN